MIIDTKYFGKMEIDESKKVYFPKGIPAFESIKEFVLIPFPDNSIYYCLQSVEQSEVAFLLIQPWAFFPEYEIKIPQEDLIELSIESEGQVQIFNIITIPNNPREMTANLMAPIIINTSNLNGKQIVLYESEYGTKHLLLNKEAV